MKLTLPTFVNAKWLIPLLELLSEYRDKNNLTVEFGQLSRITPVGLVALTAWLRSRQTKGLVTDCNSIINCPILSYLQRMDLLTSAGIDIGPESFQRHKSEGRFFPISHIPVDTDSLGNQIANIVAPGGDDFDHPNAGLYDAAYYLITELANNVRQHGLGDGYIAAQTTTVDGYVRIALADCGVGIKGSFADAGFSWAQEKSDLECITEALSPRTSCKGQPSNEGVGLTLSSRVTSLMRGKMLVASGSGLVTTGEKGEVSYTGELPAEGITGTLVTIAFKKSTASDFDQHLQRAKELEDLLQPFHNSANFTP